MIGQKEGVRTKERAMPTFNQLIRHGREEKRRTDRTRAYLTRFCKRWVIPVILWATPVIVLDLIDWNKYKLYIKLCLFVLRLVLQAKGLYVPYCIEEWLVSAFPHFEETFHSWMVRGSGASTSGEDSEPATDSWKSFDERVLLEPMPDSSSSSVNGPSHTEAADSAQTSVDPNMDPE